MLAAFFSLACAAIGCSLGQVARYLCRRCEYQRPHAQSYWTGFGHSAETGRVVGRIESYPPERSTLHLRNVAGVIMEKSDRPNGSGKPAAPSHPTMARTIRETVESIVIAFVLAFLFRTFEAEAFVIPTGSMAPTLQGRHKDIVCPECGYQYRVGAQGEREERNPELRMSKSLCPMCRFELDLDKLIVDQPRTYQTFEGDRILVNKFSYDMAEPKRFDVVVFKYPEDAKTNYIKRLVGLPGEHIYIGDPGPGARHAVQRNRRHLCEHRRRQNSANCAQTNARETAGRAPGRLRQRLRCHQPIEQWLAIAMAKRRALKPGILETRRRHA